MNWKPLEAKKSRLDRLRPLKPALLRNLEDWLRVELTYSSNALEGNTLTRQETALVLEKGLTVGGKTMREHLEATNHAAALDRLGELASGKRPIGEEEICELHGLILKGIQDEHAGRYRDVAVRISRSAVILPNPRKVPDLMRDFAAWIAAPGHPLEHAAQAHYRLVSIHPFIDGNGRTARLLMNLLLLRAGYPPALIAKEDRAKYLNALEKAQTGGSIEDYHLVIFKAVEATLDIYLLAAEGKQPRRSAAENFGKKLMRIGALGKKSGETLATLRHWTKAGLLEAAAKSPSGYVSYDEDSLDRIDQIRKFQAQGKTLQEIKNLL